MTDYSINTQEYKLFAYSGKDLDKVDYTERSIYIGLAENLGIFDPVQDVWLEWIQTRLIEKLGNERMGNAVGSNVLQNLVNQARRDGCRRVVGVFSPMNESFAAALEKFYVERNGFTLFIVDDWRFIYKDLQ